MKLFYRNSRIQPEGRAASKKNALIIPKLIPLKFSIFLVYGGMAALYPFFTLHMKSTGITLIETALISCLLPLLSCIFVPFTGILADKIGHYKWTLLGFSVLHIVFHLLILLVPSSRMMTKNSPTHISSVGIEFHCHNKRNAIFYMPNRNLLDCNNGNLTVSYTDAGENELQIEDCWTDCRTTRSFQEPVVCFYAVTGNDHYCSNWKELELQVFKNMTFGRLTDTKSHNTLNSNWEVLQFHNEEGYAIKSARCVRGKNGRAKRKRKDVECSIFCQAATDNTIMCTEIHEEGNHPLTVFFYFSFRLLGLVGLTAVFIILDTVTFHLILGYVDATFAMHRIFASIAFVCVPPLSGYLIDVSSHHNINTSDFTPAFVLFACAAASGALILLSMDLPLGSPQKNVWRNVGKAIQNTQIIAVLIVMTIAGMGEGYSTSFLFWFLETDLAASRALLGTGTAVANLLAIPLFIFSYKLIDWIGPSNLLIIGLLLTSARFLCYAALTNAFWFLAVEAISGITTAIIYLVPVHYAQAVGSTYAASLQAVITAVTFGLGRGLGSLIGGFVIAAVGHRISFQIFALTFLIVAVIYVFLDYLFFRKIKFTKSGPLPVMEIVPSDIPNRQSRTSDLFISDNVSAVLNLYMEYESAPIADFDEDLLSEADSEDDDYVYVD